MPCPPRRRGESESVGFEAVGAVVRKIFVFWWGQAQTRVVRQKWRIFPRDKIRENGNNVALTFCTHVACASQPSHQPLHGPCDRNRNSNDHCTSPSLRIQTCTRPRARRRPSISHRRTPARPRAPTVVRAPPDHPALNRPPIKPAPRTPPSLHSCARARTVASEVIPRHCLLLIANYTSEHVWLASASSNFWKTPSVASSSALMSLPGCRLLMLLRFVLRRVLSN